MLYGCQVCVSDRATEKPASCVPEENGKTSLQLRLQDRIRNTDIRIRSCMHDAVRLAPRLKWKWGGHVSRMDCSRWTYASTMWDPRIGKRSRRRPRRRWSDAFWRETGVQWTRTERDRQARKILEEIMNTMRCVREIETLPHILGFCPYSEALRKIRHHAVRSMLAEALKEVGFTVHQEVQGLATQGSVRRIDIIAIKNNSAYILDPTFRFETHADQPHEVDSEKKRICEPTIPTAKPYPKPSLVQKHSRIKLYKTLALPTLLYGSEIWVLKQRDISRLRADEMKYLRRTAGYTLLHHKRNDNILQELNMQPLEEKITE
ncbi:hypothetical protein ANN_25172 [Periplaneta americana]|uniref:NERD domain-containing protein n=1 Tax=Periplaneta americana TaxID=6978 RepID=A0ABQ8S0L2_PERAM|nr:hypothetical protein ANN_25172 [Periplaneta americana]